MDKQQIVKMIGQWQKKADTAYTRYQETGTARYDRERRNAENVADVMRLALNANDEHVQLISIRADLAQLAAAAEKAVHHHDIAEATQALNNLVSVAATYGVYGRRYG